MSAPRYIISLQVGAMTISRKLKTVLGDTEGLQQELALLLQEDGFKRLAEGLAAKYGGTEAAQQKWQDDQLGECLECRIKLPKHNMFPECIDSPETGKMFKTYYFCMDCK